MALKSILLIFWTSVAFSQQETIQTNFHFRELIGVLASDSLKGRMPGSPEIDIALAFIRNQLRLKAGLKSKVQNFTFALDDQIFSASNTYAFLNNHCDSTIIVGAHYDHIGLGGPLSKSVGTIGIHNGADDNASGVAMSIQLACQPELRLMKYNVLFVFYSGHELGLFGSNSFVHEIVLKKKKFKSVKAVINFDMIGRLSSTGNELYCAKLNMAPSLPSSEALKITAMNPDVLERLDTKPYILLGVPTYNFTTGMHVDYHKVSDDIQYINFEGMEKTLTYLMGFLQQL